MIKKTERCFWCNMNNPRYVEYHDSEWGVPVNDDGKLFEMLLLESFQAGLSWECVLNKRDAFKEAFDNYDYSKMAEYDEAKAEQLRLNPGIIRNRLKIKAAINNARIFMQLQREFGSFDSYIRHFTNGITVYEYDKTTSALSDAMSKDLNKRGMRFVGSTIIYSFLQAVGCINSHDPGCWLYRKDRL